MIKNSLASLSSKLDACVLARAPAITPFGKFIYVYNLEAQYHNRATVLAVISLALGLFGIIGTLTTLSLIGACLLFRTVCGNILNENNHTLKKLRHESLRLLAEPVVPVIRAGVISFAYLDAKWNPNFKICGLTLFKNLITLKVV